MCFWDFPQRATCSENKRNTEKLFAHHRHKGPQLLSTKQLAPATSLIITKLQLNINTTLEHTFASSQMHFHPLALPVNGDPWLGVSFLPNRCAAKTEPKRALRKRTICAPRHDYY